MSFVGALQAFSRGGISRQDLYAEVDRALQADGADPQALMDQLDQTAIDLDVPDDVTMQVRTRINWALSATTGNAGDDATIHASASSPLTEGDEATRVQGYYEPPMEGDLLGGKFELQEKIGGGGMSWIFRAIDRNGYGEPTVAVKVLNEKFGSHRDAVTTLKRETAKSRLLNECPNIVKVWDCDTDGRHVFMWMEYLPGHSLEAHLRETAAGEAFDAEEATVVLGGIANALQFAHSKNMVHADLKPANVMVPKDGISEPSDVKVIDFGIIRQIADDSGDVQMTQFDPGERLGAFTFAYASPEMLARDPADKRDDVYALGCIAYELFTGKHPFNRLKATLAWADKMEVAPSVNLTGQQLAAIRHALEFERRKRTPSAEAFMQELLAAPRRPSLPARLGKFALATVAVVVALWGGYSGYQWLGERPGATFADCSTCPEMTIVGGGEYLQGSNNTLANETPPHRVSIAQDFAMSTTEVTVAQFHAFAEEADFEAEGCTVYRDTRWRYSRKADWRNPGFEQGSDHPVVCVSRADAKAYAQWLSQRTQSSYRLPSAAEWEYAARAGQSSERWPTGNDAKCEHANIADESAARVFPGWETVACDDGYATTAPAGTFSASGFGLQDVLGNVFEWVEDCWQADYDSARADGRANMDGDCRQGETRGGSWYTQPEWVRPGLRNRHTADTRVATIGFRVVKDRLQHSQQGD